MEDVENLPLSALRLRTSEVSKEEAELKQGLGALQKVVIDDKLAKSNDHVDNSLNEFITKYTSDITRNHEYVVSKKRQEEADIKKAKKAFDAVSMGTQLLRRHAKEDTTIVCELQKSFHKRLSAEQRTRKRFQSKVSMLDGRMMTAETASKQHLQTAQKVLEGMREWHADQKKSLRLKGEVFEQTSQQRRLQVDQTVSQQSVLDAELAASKLKGTGVTNSLEATEKEMSDLTEQQRVMRESSDLRSSSQCRLEGETVELQGAVLSAQQEMEELTKEEESLTAEVEAVSKELEALSAHVNSEEWEMKEKEADQELQADKAEIDSEMGAAVLEMHETELLLSRAKMREELMMEMLGKGNEEEEEKPLSELEAMLNEIISSREQAACMEMELREEKERLAAELTLSNQQMIEARSAAMEIKKDNESIACRVRHLRRKKADQSETWKINTTLADRRLERALKEAERLRNAPLDSFDELCTPAVPHRRREAAKVERVERQNDSDVEGEIISVFKASSIPGLQRRVRQKKTPSTAAPAPPSEETVHCMTSAAPESSLAELIVEEVHGAMDLEMVMEKVDSWRQKTPDPIGDKPFSSSSGHGATDSTSCLLENRFRADIFLAEGNTPESLRNLSSDERGLGDTEGGGDDSMVGGESLENMEARLRLSIGDFFRQVDSPPARRINAAIPAMFDDSMDTDPNESIWSQNGF